MIAPVDIVPIALVHTDSFADCVDEVARERRYLAIVEGFTPEQSALWVQGNRVRGNPMYVAVQGKLVVGWCEIRRDTLPGREHGGLLGIGLRAPWRGQGLGRQLMQSAMDDAWRRGLERIELWVRSPNVHALALYQRFGFREEGRRQDVVRLDGVTEDEILMACHVPKDSMLPNTLETT